MNKIKLYEKVLLKTIQSFIMKSSKVKTDDLERAKWQSDHINFMSMDQTKDLVSYVNDMINSLS